MKRFAFLFCLFPLLLLAEDKPEVKKPDKPGKPEVKKPDDKKPPKKPHADKGRGYKPLTRAQRRRLHLENTKRHGTPIKMHQRFGPPPPPAFDCREKGWACPIWDQGSCGSCYLVSTVRVFTCAFIKAGYGKNDGSFALSAQYGMDCHDFGGCGGGNGNEVADWAVKNGWYAEKYMTLDGKAMTDYPAYEASSSRCRVPGTAKKWQIADWGWINSSEGDFNVDDVKTALTNYGVLNVALDAGGQFGNPPATITRMGTSIDHEICITAYDDTHDNGDGTKGAILFTNQWGEDWGNKGEAWCSYGAAKNTVSIFWVSAAPLPPPPTTTVPNVVGQGVVDATAALKAVGLTISVQGDAARAISSQSPVAGATAATGSAVVVVTGPPPPPPPVVIWSADFSRDWPKDKSFKLPVEAKKGWKLQLIGPGPADKPPMDDEENPFTPDQKPMPKEKQPEKQQVFAPTKETKCCGR